MAMRKLKKYGIFIILIMCILLSGCTNSPSSTRTVAKYIVTYGIIENGVINRFGAAEDDLSKVSQVVYNEYGIRFHPLFFYLEATIPEESRRNLEDDMYSIVFFDDWILTVNDKKYTISKKHIKITSENSENMSGTSVVYNPQIDIRHTNNNFMTIDIGRIEILDKKGKVVRKKKKIPPIVFRVAVGKKELKYSKDSLNVYSMSWQEDAGISETQPTVLRQGLNIVDNVLFKPMRAVQSIFLGDN